MNKNPSAAIPPAQDFLASAASGGSISTVQYYIRTLPKTLNELSGGRTPVLWAISKGRIDVVIMFEKYGADLTKKTAEGDSALACAVWSGKIKMVKMMLDRGFDPAETGVHGKTALDWARQDGNADIIKLLEVPTYTAIAARRRKSLTALAGRKKFGFKP